MKNEAEAKKIMLDSIIFKDGWGQPHKMAHTFPANRIGEGKGQSWFDMYQEISMVLPEVKTLLNIGIGLKKGGIETTRWMNIYDKMFGPIERFANVDVLPTIVEDVRKTIQRGRVTGRNADYLRECYCGNAKYLDKVKDLNGPFDMAVWSHGPEHIYREEWDECFASLNTMAKVIVIHLPWGNGYDGTPTHFSKSVRRGELEKFGFKIRYIGVEDTMQANMYGWKLGNIPC